MVRVRPYLVLDDIERSEAGFEVGESQGDVGTAEGWDDLDRGGSGRGQLRAEGRAVFGVAPSATAAEVLGEETGVGADTIDKLLIEHRLPRAPEPKFDLPAGATRDRRRGGHGPHGQAGRAGRPR